MFLAGRRELFPTLLPAPRVVCLSIPPCTLTRRVWSRRTWLPLVLVTEPHLDSHAVFNCIRGFHSVGVLVFTDVEPS